MNSITPPVLAAIALSIATSPSFAIIYTIDVSGMATWGLEGDPANDVLNLFIAPNAEITRITWDLNTTTLGVS